MKVALAGVAGLLFLFIGGVSVSSATSITATVSAHPPEYTGRCPAEIRFMGRISVSGPASVQYRFIRSDGAHAPIQAINFDRAGSRPVRTTWTLGGPGLPNYEGWQAIEVVYPQHVTSNKAGFRLRCGDGAPGAGIPGGEMPDLVVEDMKLDESCHVMVRVRNNGPGSIPDEVWTAHRPESSAVYLSINGQRWGGATIWKFDPDRRLRNPGGTAVYRSDLAVGDTAVIKAVIDHTRQVSESDERNNVRSERLSCRGGSGRPAEPGGPVAEDCVSFNPDTATVRHISGEWKIVDGSHWLFSFGGKKAEADRALSIIRRYGCNQSCYVGRPDPSFRYLLAGGGSPAGAMAGEDCVSFNPETTTVQNISGEWKITDGSHWVFSFGGKRAEAEKALSIIRRYGFSRSCYVGRPDPGFSYLRK
ncbi:MAG TPA: hypothetical protein PK036_05990 [Geobacteraceae bacterium]|mgnify:FL=1|nr:hypothetical protein [Geobacteraceae bacterium]